MASAEPEKRTRILYVSNLFYPEPWNGIMESMRLLIDGLDHQRYEPLVAVRPDDGAQTATLAERTGAKSHAFSSTRSVREVQRLCRAADADIVHIETPVTGGVPRLALGARLGGATSVIVTYQLVQTARLPLRSRIINRLAHRLLVRHTIAVSEGVAESLVTNAGLPRNSIEVIHNAAAPYEEGEAGPPIPDRSGREVWIGYFGRLAQEKGVDRLLDALSLLRQRCPDARAILVGGGYLRDELEAQATALDLDAIACFAGHRTDAREIMRRVDIVVLPSLFEGLPLVLVEAMEAKRPVVATRIPGTSEVVADGVSGLLVPPGDPVALAEALARLIEDAELRDRMGENGFARFLEHFDAQRMIGRMNLIYDGGPSRVAHTA